MKKLVLTMLVAASANALAASVPQPGSSEAAEQVASQYMKLIYGPQAEVGAAEVRGDTAAVSATTEKERCKLHLARANANPLGWQIQTYTCQAAK